MKESSEMELNRIYSGDCLEGLKTMQDECIQCCVTSPPYYKLRDYGLAGQLGLEDSPEEYVSELVTVLDEVKRLLRPDGLLWLNLGDCYWGSGKAGKSRKYQTAHKEFGRQSRRPRGCFGRPTTGKHATLKPKDLVGIPWMVAFALRKRGWYLRQDIIWHKPSVMPESCTDRCTKAHEYIFMLSKSKKYFFDQEAIKTDVKSNSKHGHMVRPAKKGGDDPFVNTMRKIRGPYLKANRRSVWKIANQPFLGAHFATFPPDIPELCIKAGSREGDVILDPFMGAGTTALVAKRLKRHYVGFELNPEYIAMAEKRLSAEGLLDISK